MRRPWHALLFATVPLYLNYQSILYDSGGNPMASGPTRLTFQITDADRTVLYEETQDVEIQNGIITTLIGNGLDPISQGPTTGLTPELFLPGVPRYLEVEADGAPADDPLELVTVPYALWSQRVAAAGVDATAIAPGAIGLAHFASGLIDDLAAAIAGSPEFRDRFAAPSGAQQVGVNTTFLYSGATTVQGVLKDLDLAIKSREEKNVSRAGDTVSGTLTFQDGARITGLPTPEAPEDAVPKAFVDQIASGLSDDLDTEKTARAEADTALQSSVDNAIDGEATTRAAADTTLQTNLTGESQARAAADTALQSNIAGEATTRAAADTTLQTNLAGESQARASADTALQANIAGEATTRADADTTLQTSVQNIAASVTALTGGNITDGTLTGADIQEGTIGLDRLATPVATKADLDGLANASISQKMSTKVGTFVPDVWDGNVYTGTIPDPDVKLGGCVYHAAFAGTYGSLNFQDPINTGKVFHIEFQLNGNNVGCAVKGDDLSGEANKSKCRVSYLTLCMKD